MNQLWHNALTEARKEKILELEKELSWIRDVNHGEMIICPFCKYTSKRGRGTARVFQEEKETRFKCFNCNVWRKL